MQSIKSIDRFHDFLAEVDRYQFDVLLVAETWRGEREEHFFTANGHRLFLSGGSAGRHGVGIVIGRSFYRRMSNVVFHAYSDRLCSLHFTLDHVSFQIFSCYMPTSWEPYHAVEQMYDLMALQLSNCERLGASAVVGGDFNAMLGDPWEGDDTDVLGTCGFGERNDRGWMMAHWVARTGLLVQSRLDPHGSVEESWTCRRAMDGQLIQIDYILSTGDLALVKGKYDHGMPVGLDHRCVHCILQLCMGKRKKLKKRISFKNWRPQLDCDDAPTPYQNHIRQQLQSTSRVTADTLEHILIQAAQKHGRNIPQTICFHPSIQLKHLRALWKRTTDPRLRKMWSLQIRNLHRREVRAWKTSQLQTFLGTTLRWKDLRKFLPQPSGQRIVVQPHEDLFASMLESLFAGPIHHVERPNVLTEPLWSLEELGRAVLRLKMRKCGDDVGLTAEVLKHAPTEFWEHLLPVYNDILHHGTVPRSWCCTLFNMLPKKMRPTQVTDFRPIANIRLFYKVFACLVLGRIEHQLDDHQPEEQHGFRRGKRIEEHLLTANVFLDKALDVGIPVWVVSLDLSKAFDRVHWPALWKSLLEQGISEHMVWTISQLYSGQFGEVIGSSGRSRKFNITGGVRQGCVLSPRLFCAMLQFAMRKWRLKVGSLGFDLSDGMPHLIDLRFADDILLFARSAMEAGKLLDSLVAELSEVGLLLNADKTVVLTSQSQPPSTLTTDHGITLRVLPGNVAQKWLGCMLTSYGSEQNFLDLQFHLQQAAKAYHANKWILEDRRVPISQRLRYFDSVVSSVACFAGGHRTMYKEHIQSLDLHFRKLCRSIVGPPPHIDWTLEWHEILHVWNERVAHFVDIAKIQSWSRICCGKYWKLAAHITKLPIHHWIQRVLRWQPVGRRRLGRPKHRWDSKLELYCRYQRLGHWEELAHDYELWERHLNGFINFCSQ